MQLEALQQSMIAAIELGPDHVDEAAFLGGRTAALRGLAVHANTISHARLVAIEDTFPRTRTRLGDANFNAISRVFIELPATTAELHSAIGRRFPAFLAEAGEDDAAALAAFEWAWLESYHAAEAQALRLADLAGLGEDAMLATPVARHPAARLAGPVMDEVLEGEVPGVGKAAALLITRPDAEVLVSPANAVMERQFEIIALPRTICNLLECGGEQAGEDGLDGLFAMLQAGALVLA